MATTHPAAQIASPLDKDDLVFIDPASPLGKRWAQEVHELQQLGALHRRTAAAAAAEHASRAAPLCKDCSHAVERDKALYCNHATTPVDLVNGNPLITVHVMRADRSAVGRVYGFEHCGSAGRLFEPHVAPDAQQVFCLTCGDRGRCRPPYSPDFTDCPDCRTRPSSTVSATTAASENPCGINA